MKTAPYPITSAPAVTLAQQLRKFPAGTLEAVQRFQGTPCRELLRNLLPGIIAYHLPRGAAPPPSPLTDDLRLAQDLGLDSLALSEMAFKMEEILGFSIETREVFDLHTVGDLTAFLGGKLGLP